MEGGEETPVLESVWGPSFTVTKLGIYFHPGDDLSIQFFSFATGQKRKIVDVGERFTNINVSPDEKWLLYAKLERIGADLMLVEDFR